MITEDPKSTVEVMSPQDSGMYNTQPPQSATEHAQQPPLVALAGSTSVQPLQEKVAETHDRDHNEEQRQSEEVLQQPQCEQSLELPVATEVVVVLSSEEE